VRRLIGAYGEALDRTRDADELTHRLLLELVRQQVEAEAELEAVSAQPEGNTVPRAGGRSRPTGRPAG
jgi:hypothetical protein